MKVNMDSWHYKMAHFSYCIDDGYSRPLPPMGLIQYIGWIVVTMVLAGLVLVSSPLWLPFILIMYGCMTISFIVGKLPKIEVHSVSKYELDCENKCDIME